MHFSIRLVLISEKAALLNSIRLIPYFKVRHLLNLHNQGFFTTYSLKIKNNCLSLLSTPHKGSNPVTVITSFTSVNFSMK